MEAAAQKIRVSRLSGEYSTVKFIAFIMLTSSLHHFGFAWVRPIVLALSLSVGAILSAAASEQLSVGDKIPETTVFTAKGEAVKLREVVSGKPTVLVFYRGGWCPYCVKHLAALGEVKGQIMAAGYQVLAISADQPSKLSETPSGEKMGYTLLSDSSMEAAKAFGITFKVPDELVSKYKNEYKIDLEAASGETHHVLPHPAVFIVDPKGTVRFAHVNPDYKSRLSPAQVLEAIGSAGK